MKPSLQHRAKNRYVASHSDCRPRVAPRPELGAAAIGWTSWDTGRPFSIGHRVNSARIPIPAAPRPHGLPSPFQLWNSTILRGPASDLEVPPKRAGPPRQTTAGRLVPPH